MVNFLPNTNLINSLGNFKNFWKCHIKPDWLLIWQQDDKELILLFIDTGTLSDLF